MAYTPRDVFNAAMLLSDNGDESTNNKEPFTISDNTEHINRSLEIMNVLQGEIFPYSDTFKVTSAKKRPTIARIDSWDMEIGMDDYCTITVMPYGLAANLFIGEDPSLASFCQQRYEELLRLLRQGIPGMQAEAEDIEDVYGGGYMDESGEWHGYNQYGFQYVSRW